MKHQHWFKTWQDRQLSDPAWLALPRSARGLIYDLRAFAARQNDEGNTGMTLDSLAKWYGIDRRLLAKDTEIARKNHLLLSGKNGSTFVIPGWTENQETAAAARVRKYRAKAAERNSNAPVTVTVTPNVTGEVEAEADVEAEAATPLPPADAAALPALEQLAFKVCGSALPGNLVEQVQLHGAEHVKAALLETERAGGKPFRYTIGILQRWGREGYPAAEQASNGKPTCSKIVEAAVRS